MADDDSVVKVDFGLDLKDGVKIRTIESSYDNRGSAVDSLKSKLENAAGRSSSAMIVPEGLQKNLSLNSMKLAYAVVRNQGVEPDVSEDNIFMEFSLDTSRDKTELVVCSAYKNVERASDKLSQILDDAASSNSPMVQVRDVETGDFVLLNTMKLESVEIYEEE